MRRCLPLVALLFAATPARAHEVLHAIERGKAIAVKAYFADGEALAYTEYQVFSPADASSLERASIDSELAVSCENAPSD